MLEKIPIRKKALILVELAMAGLCIYRVYDYWTTGFFVSDEYGYFYNAVHGAIYGGRWFFGWLNILLFRIPGLANVDGFALILPFYLFLWSGLTIYAFYRILILLELDDRSIALSLLSCYVLVSFVLLSLGFLTEPVGLALTMGGIFFVLRYFGSQTDGERLVFPLVAALLLGAAGGTREPYNALLVLGGVAVIIIARKQMGKTEKSRYGAKTMALFSIALFVLPGGFLYYSNSYATSQAPSLGQQIGQTILTNPPTVTRNVTSTVTRTSTVTSTITTTAIFTQGGVVKTNVTTYTVTSTTETVAIVTRELNYPFYAKSLLLNTLAIFIGGIILGWGPLAFLIGLAGFLVLVRAFARGRRTLELLILLTVLASLGSYFVVSYIFAPDPGYLTFQNYSTIIRFSDTALPAYFLLSPFAIRPFSNKRRAIAFGGILLAFIILAVPAYQVFASSDLAYTGANPFQLGYRSDGVLVRNYFDSIQTNRSIDLVGVPYGFSFTPGVQDIRNLNVYAFTNDPLYPRLVASNLSLLKWPVFYMYVTSQPQLVREAPFFYQFVNSTAVAKQGSNLPFKILSSRVVVQGPDFALYEVQLQWH